MLKKLWNFLWPKAEHKCVFYVVNEDFDAGNEKYVYSRDEYDFCIKCGEDKPNIVQNPYEVI